MKPVARALADAARQLEASSDSARLDAELLMAEAYNIDRDRLLLAPPDRPVPDRFWEMLERRKRGEPIAYITGRRAFWNIDLHVGPGVLIPRPDSEVLIASAIDHFGRHPDGPRRVLDLGTGPGTLLLATLDLWPDARGIGVDMSRQALSYASANARRLGLEGRAEFRLGNWADDLAGSFDLLLCNPPYVATKAKLGPGVAEYEPSEALFAGPDGLDDIRRLAPEIPRLLAPGGLAAVEIGADQAEAGPAILQRDGLRARLADDLGGRPRAVLLTWA
ncbi:peptide chain release factor N(5)-glutamine methyltransferase [Sphingomonas sinipercae]|uniref:Release factor glutamine methyltransferase n=1 Tax=Sphingomonas sinipercae TaxID=2714944 RepID=A0A6G7ZKH9_9SPHN|nr:peptide chain release factor N(5)-glutamine methyltransferase [Sphingomonas sinipercae]QIL01406.1 peptide chain release factor N(5)-glutamine methyltransferase [Sphingomonas sinipercae]